MSQERCRTNSFFVSQYVKQNEEAISYRHYSIDCENCVTIFTSLLFMILACAVHAAQFTLLNAHCRHSPPPHLHSLLKKHGNVVSPSSLWPRVPSWRSSIHLIPEAHIAQYMLHTQPTSPPSQPAREAWQRSFSLFTMASCTFLEFLYTPDAGSSQYLLGRPETAGGQNQPCDRVLQDPFVRCKRHFLV